MSSPEDMAPEEFERTRIEIMANLFGALDGRVPFCLLGVTMHGQEFDEKNMRTVTVPLVRVWLQDKEVRERIVATFRHHLEKLGRHPEDVGPISPEKRR